jgi:hypothetical protein
MDAAELSQLFAVSAIALALGRFVLGSLDRSEHGFASLFVPPDRDLGWPHGVQESDEPWGWRAPLVPVEVIGEARAASSPEPLRADRLATVPGDPPIPGSLVVPPARVTPVRLVMRPL